jgi:hypothetical protein
MEKTTVAEAVSALTNDQRLIARDAGFQFAKNQLANIETASTYAAMLGTDPTLDAWEAGRIDWVSGYVDANPHNTGNAADKAWQRFADLLDSLFGMVKPKSTNPAAEKKRAEREKKAADLLAKYQDQSVSELRATIEHAYQVLSQNPTHKDSLKQVKELDKVLKAKQSAANKQHGEELKELRNEVIDSVRKCTDMEVLSAVLYTLSTAEA